MKTGQIKLWLLSIGGAVVALFLTFYGIKLLFAPNDATDRQLFLLGVSSMLAGIFILAAQIYIPKKFKVSGALVFLGVYFFARASGTIEGALFMRLLGLGSLIGAGLIIDVTYLATKKIKF